MWATIHSKLCSCVKSKGSNYYPKFSFLPAPPDASQTDVYRQCVAPLVSACLEGYNATVFAYGQTGSGKSHTIGSESGGGAGGEGQGIIPRALEEIFQHIQVSWRLLINCYPVAWFSHTFAVARWLLSSNKPATSMLNWSVADIVLWLLEISVLPTQCFSSSGRLGPFCKSVLFVHYIVHSINLQTAALTLSLAPPPNPNPSLNLILILSPNSNPIPNSSPNPSPKPNPNPKSLWIQKICSAVYKLRPN